MCNTVICKDVDGGTDGLVDDDFDKSIRKSIICNRETSLDSSL